MSQLFADLRVIDAASYLAGPGAATILGDYGADVIKVEPPAGDAYRKLAGRHPINYNWLLTSRNKRSIALDLRSADGREALLRLIDGADVLLLNFRRSDLDRFGLNYDELAARNPRLVYAHLSGYGTRGQEADRKAYDATAWFARSGVLDAMHDRDVLPQVPAGGVGDHASAMTVFAAIVMALYRRQQTGKGGYVATSLAANGAWAMGMHLQGALSGFDLSAVRDQRGFSSPFMAAYRTADARYVLLAMADATKEWPGLARALHRADWLTDPRYPDMRAVMKARATVKAAITEAIAGMPFATLTARLDAEDVTHSEVRRTGDVIRDAQLIANNVIIRTGHDDPDYQWTIANPIEFDGEPHRKPALAPQIGQHTREILAELGYSDAELDALIDSGAAHSGDRQPQAQ